MFIQTEETPNPATLKYLPGQSVMESGTANFPTPEEAAASPLASRLHDINGVTGAFFGTDFITVTKADDRDWEWLKPQVFGVIMEHFTAGAPLFIDGYAVTAHATSNEDDEFDGNTEVWHREHAAPLHPGSDRSAASMTQRPCVYHELNYANLFRFGECLGLRERQRKINAYENI